MTLLPRATGGLERWGAVAGLAAWTAVGAPVLAGDLVVTLSAWWWAAYLAYGVLLGLAAVPLVLLARSLSTGLPLAALRPFISLGRMAMPTLVWGGLRGGISIALALGLPEGGARTVLLATTYIVVLFSVLAQGGTIAPLVARLTRTRPEAP